MKTVCIAILILLSVVRPVGAEDNADACPGFRLADVSLKDCKAVLAKRGLSDGERALALTKRAQVRMTLNPLLALRDVNHALRLDAGLREAWLQAALLKSLYGDLASAIPDLTQALIIEPEPEIYIFRGQIFAAYGLTSLAKSDYSSAVEIAADDHSVRRQRGHFYCAHGEQDAAVHDLFVTIRPDGAKKEDVRAMLKATGHMPRDLSGPLSLRDRKAIALWVADRCPPIFEP